jgi:hypothetical protein
MPIPLLLEPAVQIIDELFGPDTADQYRAFYQGKTDTMILASMDELLREIVGPAEAVARTKSLRQKLNGGTPQ